MSEQPPTRYLLLTMGRTGSTLLSRMLRQHPQIVDYQELFNVDFKAAHEKCTSRVNSLNYWLSFPPDRKYRERRLFDRPENEPSASEILTEHVWYDGYDPRIRAVGLKLLHYQFGKQSYYPELRSTLEEFLPSIRVILLKRDNLLETYTSHRIASEILQWHITSEHERKPRPRLRIDVEELTYAFEHYDAAWSELQYLSNLAQDQLQLSYDNLVSSRKQCWFQSLKFLGVPEIDMPEVSLKKVENREISDIIENFHELKDAFSGTEWGRFFGQ